MSTISFNVNNGGKLKLIQREHDGKTLIIREMDITLTNTAKAALIAAIEGGKTA